MRLITRSDFDGLVCATILRELGIADKQGIFYQTPPNLGEPWNKFEEGQWYHYSNFTSDYAWKILEDAEIRFKKQMVRNRHAWIKKEQNQAQDTSYLK